MSVVRLPLPEPGDEVRWVGEHLGSLCSDEPRRSGRFVGTQAAADAALVALELTGYARRRNEVLPVERRGASGLSPWIRHGLITLPRAWSAVDGPGPDVHKFRDELRWQEYARHLYARLGRGTAEPLRRTPAVTSGSGADPWDRSMRCVAVNLDELERDGWVVNQARMWLASQWSVRHGARWRDGEDVFFAHLLDGSRAANRLGWQWTVGTGTSKVYGFSRSQVRRRAPGLCDTSTSARLPDRGLARRPAVRRGHGRSTTAPRPRRAAHRGTGTGRATLDTRGGLVDRRVVGRRRPCAGRTSGTARRVRVRRAAARSVAAVVEAPRLHRRPTRGAGRAS